MSSLLAGSCPRRTIGIDEAIWEDATIQAKTDGLSMRAVISALLAAYNDGTLPPHLPDYRPTRSKRCTSAYVPEDVWETAAQVRGAGGFPSMSSLIERLLATYGHGEIIVEPTARPAW
ncbi:hypothetical protein [Streptomyces sp. cg36]|uniref:hypothetical protein n=1 Tax=Streptomyces sp. cg36 TaxID=3238798 RepID=UPI0034E213B4